MPVSIFGQTLTRRSEVYSVVQMGVDFNAARFGDAAGQNSKFQAPSTRKTSSTNTPKDLRSPNGACVFGAPEAPCLSVRPSRCSPRSVNPPPAPTPSGAPRRTASDLDGRTNQAAT